MLYSAILIFHIVAGFTALLSGGISFVATKGKALHKRSGMIYTAAMLAVGLSAIIMCLLRYNPFLFTVGIFSTYMTVTGYRSLQYHKKSQSIALLPDWLLLISAFLLAGGFSLHMILEEGLSLQGIQLVLMVFMSILLLFIISDLRLLIKTNTLSRKGMLRRHIGRMGGAYISTLTAFLVTNVQTEPLYLAWLLPTAIGTPFIIFFITRYTSKKKAAPQATKA